LYEAWPLRKPFVAFILPLKAIVFQEWRANLAAGVENWPEKIGWLNCGARLAVTMPIGRRGDAVD